MNRRSSSSSSEAEDDDLRFIDPRSEEHTSELQSLRHLVCRLLLEKKKDRGEQAAERVRDDPGGVDVHPGGERRGIVAAHRVKLPVEGAAAERQQQDRRYTAETKRH